MKRWYKQNRKSMHSYFTISSSFPIHNPFVTNRSARGICGIVIFNQPDKRFQPGMKYLSEVNDDILTYANAAIIRLQSSFRFCWSLEQKKCFSVTWGWNRYVCFRRVVSEFSIGTSSSCDLRLSAWIQWGE